MSDKMMKRETDEMSADVRHDGPTYQPRVDVLENADEYLVVADLPGVTQDDLTLDVERELLTIEGEMSKAQDNWTPAFVEAQHGSYRREFRLPHGLDLDKVNAELTNGVLAVHLPKSAEMKPRKIAIKVD